MKKVIFFGLIITLVTFSCAQEEKSPVEGTWQMTEYSESSSDTSFTIVSPQPGLFIFTKGYYSIIYVSGNEPRPSLPDDYTRSTLTDEQIRSSFMGFFANSGKYELDGAKLTVFPIVALEPNYMSNTLSEYEFKIEGETMELKRTSATFVRQYKLSRLEL